MEPLVETSEELDPLVETAEELESPVETAELESASSHGTSPQDSVSQKKRAKRGRQKRSNTALDDRVMAESGRFVVQRRRGDLFRDNPDMRVVVNVTASDNRQTPLLPPIQRMRREHEVIEKEARRKPQRSQSCLPSLPTSPQGPECVWPVASSGLKASPSPTT